MTTFLGAGRFALSRGVSLAAVSPFRPVPGHRLLGAGFPESDGPSGRRQRAARPRHTHPGFATLCVDETFELGDGGLMTPAAALGKRVLTIGTLSKLVWAGLRIGWLHGPRVVVNRLAADRSSQDVADRVAQTAAGTDLVVDHARRHRRPIPDADALSLHYWQGDRSSSP